MDVDRQIYCYKFLLKKHINRFRGKCKAYNAGWEDGAVGKVLALEAEGSEFKAQNLCKNIQASVAVVMEYNAAMVG